MAKITKKQAALSWSALLKAVRNSTPVDITESIESQVSRVRKLEADPEEWFKYYFPKFVSRQDGTGIEPTPFHKAASKRVISNPEWYETRHWSRELAKSTRTMMEVFYLCFVGHPLTNGLRHKKGTVILTSCTIRNAMKLLKPYKANLEANQRLIQDYGEQKGLGQWEKDEFVTKSGKAFYGVGLDGQARGLKNDESRPDILLFDDVDTDQDCRNPTMVKKNWDWIDGAIMGTRSISCPTTIIWCGNIIAKDCCIVRATKLADHSETINIRDKNGRSTWPAKNTEDHIDRVLSQRSYASVQKEYYNNPIVEGSVFKQMSYKPALPLREYSVLVCYTDPSYKATSDYKVTALVGKWRDEYHIIKAFVEQTTTAQLIKWHYAIMDFVGNNVCYYRMEEVFMQDVIVKEVSDAGQKTGRTIPITGDTRKKPDKFMRIESLLEPLNRNGQLYLNEAEKENPHMDRLKEQFLAFAPGSNAHDDAPDAVEGAVWIINTKCAQMGGIMTFERPVNLKRY